VFAVKTGYTEPRCQANPYVSWGSENPAWHGQSGVCIACSSATELEPACDGQMGMDYGGNPMGSDGVECGFAPTVAIIADNNDFSPPGWYTGPMVVDPGMASPLQCQHRCYENPDCDFFAYKFLFSGATLGPIFYPLGTCCSRLTTFGSIVGSNAAQVEG